MFISILSAPVIGFVKFCAMTEIHYTLANAPLHEDPGPRSCGRCAGRSPAWQLGPGVERDEGEGEGKIQILSTGSL
jgi:hypothetical protein